MRLIAQIFGTIFFSTFLIILHFAVTFILPYPWSNINIVFALIVIIMFGWRINLAIWFTFFFYFIIEQFLTTPFGAALCAGVISVMIIGWLYENFFTNKSWHSAAVLSASAVLVYRILYFLISYAFGKISDVYTFNISNIIFYFWEVVLTGIMCGIFVFCLSIYSKRFRTDSVVI